MYTKKDLAQKFDLAENTVYSTLKCSGLNTSKHEYSQEEVDEFFIPARKMLDAGRKYKQVKEYFEMKRGKGTGTVEPQVEEEFDSEGFSSNQAVDATDSINVAVAQTVADMVERSVDEVLPYVPALVVQTLNQKLNSGEMKQAFNTMRSQIREHKGSGAAFLLQKIRSGQNHLMSGAPESRQLPSASPENSTDSSEDS